MLLYDEVIEVNAQPLYLCRCLLDLRTQEGGARNETQAEADLFVEQEIIDALEGIQRHITLRGSRQRILAI